jgi:hypothetical protein
MDSGEIFGEITFMFGGGATVSILADEEDVRIYTIDKTSLQVLFTPKPELAGQFHKFLATQIGKRVLPKQLKLDMELQRRKTRTASLSAETNQFFAAITAQDEKKPKRRKSFSNKRKDDDSSEDKKYVRVGIPTLELPMSISDHSAGQDTPRPALTGSTSFSKTSSKSVSNPKTITKTTSSPNVSGMVHRRKASFSQLTTQKEEEEVPDWMKKLKQKKRLSSSGLDDI